MPLERHIQGGLFRRRIDRKPPMPLAFLDRPSTDNHARPAIPVGAASLSSSQLRPGVVGVGLPFLESSDLAIGAEGEDVDEAWRVGDPSAVGWAGQTASDAGRSAGSLLIGAVH
jgi:hypothetical protein